MRNLKILFTTEDEIFFVNEAKQLEFYYENGDGQNHFREMFGYEETNLNNWTDEQLSEMVSNGLYVDDVDLFSLWMGTSLFEKHPELYGFVVIDKCFRDLEIHGHSRSVIAFVDILTSLETKEYNKNNEYSLQCLALYHKLAKKEAKEAEAKRIAKRTIFDDMKLDKQARHLEQVLSNQSEQIVDLGFTFEPRIELQTKKAS